MVLVLVVASCAPTGPKRTSEPTAGLDWSAGLGVPSDPRAATTAEQRADQAVAEIEAQLASNELSVGALLDRLSPYTINELSWQLRQARDKPALSSWLELALIVETHKLHPAQLDRQLDLWQTRRGNQLGFAGAPTQQAHEWVQSWRNQSHGPKTIGIVLPGQSSLATPGKRIRDGLINAWLDLSADQRPELKFYYVDDDDARDLLGVIDQATQDEVEWLIGPLPREQVEFVLANRSARWSVPTLFLNLPRPAGLRRALGGPRLAFALDPETEAVWAARHAARMGLDRGLVLAQDSAWGDRMATQFVQTFRQSGQTIIDRAVYDPAQVDHSALLERVLGLDQSRARIDRVSDILGESVDAQPQRRQDIEFIFLAARADDARQIRPQLRFFRAEDLPIVSTSYAVEGAVDPRRDVDLEGIWMPMAPWFMNETALAEQRREASELYPQMTTPTLSHLYAMGQDLVALMRWWDAMLEDPNLSLPGLTGQLRVDAQGQIQRKLPWVLVESGRAKPMEWN